MKRLIIRSSLYLFLFFLLIQPIQAQTVDPILMAEINRIKAIDNHSHPSPLLEEGQKDLTSDFFYTSNFEPQSVPVRLDPASGEYIAAWKALYGYPYNDMTEAHMGELIGLKARLKSKHGKDYPSWILKQVGIELMLVNRKVMGPGLEGPSFRWVPIADPLLYPLNTANLRKQDPDSNHSNLGNEEGLKYYLNQLNIKSLPENFNEYLTNVVTPILERQRGEGALAIKFVVGLLRALNFDEASEKDAARIYQQYARGGEPTIAEYKLLQDFLFRYVSREAGRLGLLVHIHTGVGPGTYYKLGGSNPLMLESVFNDPTLRKTKFVLVHGGWPFTKETGILILTKPNVYADFSAQTFLTYPEALSEVLRNWLEMEPKKILFGTDAFAPAPPVVGWEDLCWLTTTTSRKALGIALTKMIKSGQISRKRAIELARMVLRENAISLYGLKN